MNPKGKHFINVDKNGNKVIQNAKREAVAVEVDGKKYDIRRKKGDKF